MIKDLLNVTFVYKTYVCYGRPKFTLKSMKKCVNWLRLIHVMVRGLPKGTVMVAFSISSMKQIVKEQSYSFELLFYSSYFALKLHASVCFYKISSQKVTGD